MDGWKGALRGMLFVVDFVGVPAIITEAKKPLLGLILLALINVAVICLTKLIEDLEDRDEQYRKDLKTRRRTFEDNLRWYQEKHGIVEVRVDSLSGTTNIFVTLNKIMQGGNE